MKELSIEEKAKRYDEAIDVCRKLYSKAKADGYTSDIEDYEQMFPELAESEDERIRKALIRCFSGFEKDSSTWGGFKRKDILAWLEAQGEQKPAWSEEDEKFFNTVLWHICNSISNGESTDIHCDTTEWFKSLKERYTWKPSDEQMEALYEETQKSDRIKDERIVSLYEDLKKLREE